MAVTYADQDPQSEDAGVLPVIPAAPVSSSFCVPHVTQLQITRQVGCCNDCKFTVKDHHGELLFTVATTPWTFNSKRVISDCNDNALLSLQRKVWSIRRRWDASRGGSSHDPKDLLFTMQNSSVLPWNQSFKIWLAGAEKADFTLKGDFWSHHFTIYCKDVAIAEADKKISASSIFLGKDKLHVTLYPEIDQAFIAAILIIRMEVERDKRGNGGRGGGD